MKKLLLFFTFALCGLFATVGYSLMTKTEYSNWLKIVNGQKSKYLNLNYAFSALSLNGKILQNKLDCFDCPMKIVIDNKNSSFVIQSKQFLRQYATDTLELLFEYDYWIQRKLLVQPKFTYYVNSECDTISKIVFTEIVGELNKNRNDKSDSLFYNGAINLGNVFNRLIKGDLKEWMTVEKSRVLAKNEGTAKSDCFQYFKALEYIADGSQSGFKSRKYNLQDSSLIDNEKMPAYLMSISSSIRDIIGQFNGKKGDLNIIITGYADTVNIKSPIFFIKEDKGDRVFYKEESCSGNEYNYLEPVSFYNHDSIKYTEIKDVISVGNNCALSAVRAYYATKFFQQELGDKLNNTIINYFYCAGGVLTDGEIDNQRKITISIKFSSVKTNE